MTKRRLITVVTSACVLLPLLAAETRSQQRSTSAASSRPNVILIMTTNAGAADQAKAAFGFGRDRREGEDVEAIERMFTPEFRNRLDAVVSFAPLPREVIVQVVEKFVLQLEAQLMDRNVHIELSPAAADWLARDYLEHFTDRVGTWLDSRAGWPEPWQPVLGLEDHLVLVTAEQMTALREEMIELLERYRRLGQGNPQAKRVSVYTCALPVDREL